MAALRSDPVPGPAPIPASALPRPPMPERLRTQIESLLVLRRNPLELWGPLAYEMPILPGRFLGREQLLLNAPEAIRHVLVTNHANYVRTPATHRVLQPVLGEGLFLAEGEAWRHQRRTIAPALAPRSIPMLARHVAASSAEAEMELDARRGRPIELMPHMQSLALNIAGRSMFSLEMDRFGTGLRGMLNRYAVRFAKPGALDLVLPQSVRSPLDIGRAAFRREWLGLMDRILDARETQPADPDRPRDLFDLLAAARDPETGEGFDRAQLRDEVATLMLAGHETTAVTLFWSLFLAALRPEHGEAIAAEAAALDLSPNNAAAAIKSLVRTRAHVEEALRLYPPAFLIVRQAIGADEVMGHPIAPGTVVTVSPWVLHRHRSLWPNPDGFDPNRFLPGATAPERFAYLPFGAGPRICVGAQFALTEAVLVLARLMQRFRVELFSGAGVLPRGLVTTQPDRPVRFLLSRRAR